MEEASQHDWPLASLPSHCVSGSVVLASRSARAVCRVARASSVANSTRPPTILRATGGDGGLQGLRGKAGGRLARL